METKVAEKRFFLTVHWCNKGKRGIFCSKEGNPFSQDHPFTEDEAWEVLEAFDLILNPQSLELTEEELKEYNKWYPLAEYSNKYGIATKGDKIEDHITSDPSIQSIPRDSGIMVPESSKE